MSPEKGHKVNKWTDYLFKIVVTVMAGIILSLLISGGTKYQEIKENSEKVPQMLKYQTFCSEKWKQHDSTELVRYIMDTMRSGQTFRAIVRVEKELHKKK